MLSAEHLALQHRLVQQLVSIREREMNYMLSRYETIGTQAALLAGFAISSLSSIDAEEDTTPAVGTLYYIMSMVCGRMRESNLFSLVGCACRD